MIKFAPDKNRQVRVVRSRLTSQSGVTLIELLVGLVIGLLVVVVALGTLVVSRQVSSTVTETSQLQQQAAYAFRIIGQQVRQASSIKLNLAYGLPAGTAFDAADTVAFETGFDRKTKSIGGVDTPATGQYKLSLGYQNYEEKVFNETVPKSLLRNCLGEQTPASALTSGFVLSKAAGAPSGDLSCAGSGGAQPLISKVSDFQVRYLVQDAGTTSPTITYASATTASANWPSVFGIEVCLELVGDEVVPTAGATYRDCSWNTGDAEKARGDRLRMVFRNTYQIRSQNGI